MRGRIDTAWMLTIRGLFQQMSEAGGFVLYPMVDSSSQGGRDYEMMVLNIVREQDLQLLHYKI